MRKRRQTVERDLSREQEILDTVINPNGVGEAQAIKDMLSNEFVTMPDAKAVDVALALQQIILGQASLLNRIDEQAEHINKIRVQMNKYDEDSRKWNENNKKFLEDIEQRSSNLRVTGDRLEKIQAQAAKINSDAYRSAHAKVATDRLMFVDELRRMPRVIVTSPGVPILSADSSGQPALVIEPEEVRIKNYVWILKPNIPTEVPICVQRILENRRASEAETAERKSVLSLDGGFNSRNEIGNVNKAWRDIDQKYSAPTEVIPEGR